jgi:ATP-grasp domain
MWYPIVLKLCSLTITHKADAGGVQLNLRDANAVKAAFQAIKPSVNEKVGAEHFQGVTVQPMVKLDGYELIIGSSLEVWINAIGDLAEVIQGYTSVASERSGCSVQSSLLAVFHRLGLMPAAALQATCAASRASSSVMYSYCPSAWTAPPLTVPPSVPVASIKRIRTKKAITSLLRHFSALVTLSRQTRCNSLLLRL